MVRIPTYESQQTQVASKQYFNTENPIGAAIKGVAQGLGAAGGVIESAQDYQKIKKQEAYEINTAPRMDAITNSTVDLNKQNNEIRAGMSAAPNPDKANELLNEKFNDIINNPPKGLDAKSLSEWQKLMYAEKKRLALSNLSWGNTAAKAAGKKAAQQANLTLFNMQGDDAEFAGMAHLGWNSGTLSLDEDARYTDKHIIALNPDDKKIQDYQHSRVLIGQTKTPLETKNTDRGEVKGILGDSLDEFEGVPASGWWIFGKKGQTKQELGTQKISEYFDKVRENIDASGLGTSEKKALTSFADAQQRARQREFDAYIQGTNLELQADLARIPDPAFVSEYFTNLQAQQESELELNPIRENKTVDELRADDYLANLTFGNDYVSVAARFGSVPMGNVADFAEPLKIAINTLSMPIGEWDKAELVKKYAPGGTLNEMQALESLIQNAPNLTLTGAEIDLMKPENGFDEFDWAMDVMSEISSMPDSTNEEKQRKQAATNHAIYQAKKEVNGGLGFSNQILAQVFNDTMVGKQSDGNYSSLLGNDAIIREMQKVGMLVGNIDSNQFLHKEAVSIIGRGLLDANAIYRQNQDINEYKTHMRKINQDVLSAQYRGVLDIEDLQNKLDNHKPALFVYNGAPYEYLGFSGDKIFIKSGNLKSSLTLGE